MPKCSSVVSGYALVMVLWLTSMLALLTSIAFSSVRTEVQLIRSDYEVLKGKALAEAGLWMVLRNAVDSNIVSLNQYTNYRQVVYFDDVPVSVETHDVAGKINLNYAPRELIARLLASSSLSLPEADKLSYNISDWIDADSDSVVNIDEGVPYRESGLDYSPRNKPFSTLDELRLVAGMSDAVYRDIAPYLTLYGSYSHINKNASDPDLIRRLAVASKDGESWESRLLSENSSNILIVSSTVELDGSAIKLSAIVEILPLDRGKAYRILDWDI